MRGPPGGTAGMPTVSLQGPAADPAPRGLPVQMVRNEPSQSAAHSLSCAGAELVLKQELRLGMEHGIRAVLARTAGALQFCAERGATSRFHSLSPRALPSQPLRD